MKPLNEKKKMTTHLEFAEKSQLLRWFHERSIEELKAMKKGLLTIHSAKRGRKSCK